MLLYWLRNSVLCHYTKCDVPRMVGLGLLTSGSFIKTHADVNQKHTCNSITRYRIDLDGEHHQSKQISFKSLMIIMLICYSMLYRKEEVIAM